MRISDWSSDVCSADLTGDPILAERVLAAEANISLILPQQGYPFVELGDRDIALDPATMTGDYTLPVEPGPRGSFGDIVTEGDLAFGADHVATIAKSEEHTSELQSLMRISYAVFCLKKKIKTKPTKT